MAGLRLSPSLLLLGHGFLKSRGGQRCTLHCSSARYLPIFPPKPKKDETSPGVKTKSLIVVQDFFKEVGENSNYDRKQFINTVDDFNKLKRLKRFGYGEFVAAALPAMSEFGVEKDLESYKALIRIFPKGAFVPERKIQFGFYPYFVQQKAAIDILNQMQRNNVMPDRELEKIIIDAFSKFSHVWLKLGRMNYWMTKFKNANPFPLPESIPTDPLELAIVALKRMSVDPQCDITVYRTSQIQESAEDTWICFVQSDSQCKLIEELDPVKQRVSVDGPFNVWVAEYSVSYFILFARDLRPKENRDLVKQFLKQEHEKHDVSDIALSNFGSLVKEEAVDPMRQVHEQEDGTILAIVATGTSSQESLITWIRMLERENPRLRSIPVVISNLQAASSMTNDAEKCFSGEPRHIDPINDQQAS